MTRDDVDDRDEVWVQLATRIPRDVHRAVKLACVHADTTVQAFFVAALREKFAREAGRRKRGAARG
jgi:hypothetical protein